MRPISGPSNHAYELLAFRDHSPAKAGGVDVQHPARKSTLAANSVDCSEIEGIIAKMLEKECEARFQTMGTCSAI
jgi:hypothetical protein